jgi:hypothetical protein
MDTIIKLFEIRPELSQKSIKTYASCIYKVLEITKAKDIKIFYEQPEKVIEQINKVYDKPHTIKTKYASIIVLLKLIPLDNIELTEKINKAIKLYLDNIDKCTKNITNELSKNEKTEKQLENWTTPDDIIKIKEYLKNKTKDKKFVRTMDDLINIRNYIIYMFYDECPSRCDLADCKIIFKSNKPLSEDYNYIVIDKKNKSCEYHLLNYKTKNTYGEKIIKLSDDLYNLLLPYKKQVEKYNADGWLLLTEKCEKMNRHQLGLLYGTLGHCINKTLSITQNRHIKISEVVPIDLMQKLSDKMAHSISEQVFVYSKKTKED